MPAISSFSIVYHVEVDIPEPVFRTFGHTTEYGKVSCAAHQLVGHSGQNTYSNVTEWGEAPTQQQAKDFADFWGKKVLEWERQIDETPKEADD